VVYLVCILTALARDRRPTGLRKAHPPREDTRLKYSASAEASSSSAFVAGEFWTLAKRNIAGRTLDRAVPHSLFAYRFSSVNRYSSRKYGIVCH